MGKHSRREKDADATILYKKSQHTIYTQSKTCSGLSQFYTRSGVIQIKKTVSQSQTYVEGDKVKRDLSIETDICILRRYVRKNKNRLSVQEGSKSKYSTVVDTEIDTIEEFQHDTSACGDSGRSEPYILQHDIEKLMIENFKNLLNSWVKEHLLERKDSKETLESILYSLVHRNELDKTDTSSRSTYVLNRECLSLAVKNKKVATKSMYCQYCKNENWIKAAKANIRKESSCHSTPASHKNIKVISTLSIPKNLHKRKLGRSDSQSNHKINKTKQRNIVLSINESSRILDYSSFDLITLSTNSFTKRCVKYDCDGNKKKRKKKRHIVFFPKPFYKSATETTTDDNKRVSKEAEKCKLVQLPSLVKSIFADDPANITSTDDNIHLFRNDNFTMTDVNDSLSVIAKKNESVESCTKNEMSAGESVFLHESLLNEEDRSDPMMTIDFMDESLELLDAIEPKIEERGIKTRATGTDNKNIDINQQTEMSFNNHYVFKLRKNNKRRFRVKRDKKDQRRQQFLSHCQNIFQYFADYENKNNIKLDIHISVIPVNDQQHKSTEMSIQNLNSCEKSETIVYNVDQIHDKPNNLDEIHASKRTHNIIPLLDGADNQAKYIFKSESCSEKTSLSHENNNLTVDRSTITETEIIDDIIELKSIINELSKTAAAFVKEHIRKTVLSNNAREQISKGIQFSNEISKHPLLSGIKLSKEPKKIDIKELYSRLMKKSTSYNIIDSESILRVTDMTSAANLINKSAKSLPKYKSMVEITDQMEKRKLLTYFYDEYNNSDYYNKCEQACPKMFLKMHNSKTCPERDCLDSTELIMHDSNCQPGGCELSSPCDSDEDDCEYDEEKHCYQKVCRRNGMGFGEGCIYCVLIWIPVIIISCLFYSYVIKDAIQPNSHNSTSNNTVKLSDLGF